MPISSSYDTQNGLITIECSGVINDVGLLEMLDASIKGLVEIGDAAILLDFTEVESLEVSPKAISNAAHENRRREITEGVKMAVVAPSDVSFGLARMYQLSRDDADNVRVFRERVDAREWLGLDHRGDSSRG